MKATIVGTRSLELDGDVVQIVLDELGNLGSRGFTEILIRKPLRRSRRPFEALTASLAEVMGFTVTDYVPEPGGRALVFLRDVEMVRDSDEVVAFFPQSYYDGEDVMSGTAHVVDKALDQAKPVRAYAVVEGQAVLVGSDNEDSRV